MADLPASVLFTCDHNSVRSPMAEGIAKLFYGHSFYIQSAGVRNDLDVDGFCIAVCEEMNVDINRHRARSFDEMQDWGDDLGGFDLIISLSPASQRKALELTRYYHLDVEYWPIMDPTGLGETREDKLSRYRQSRDQIVERLVGRFGPPIPKPLK
jgi:arsenate reductase